MAFVPLPYISRPDDEARLHTFLLERLQGQSGVAKALLLSGRAGVGKRTLIRHVYASDQRLRAFGPADAVTRELLQSSKSPAGRRLSGTHAEVLGQLAGLISPLGGVLYNIAYAVVKDRVLGEPAHDAPTAIDYSTFDEITEPVLAIIPLPDPENLEAVQLCARLVREAYLRPVPLAILFLDDSPRPRSTQDDEKEREHSAGFQALRQYLGHDEQAEVLPLQAFSEAQCRSAFLSLGLTSDWAGVLYQLSDGGPAELQSLWKALQAKRILTPPTGGGPWKAREPATAGAAWELIRDRLIGLLEPRCPRGTVHEDRLMTALLLAASMGPRFLPQAVAECVVLVDPKRAELDQPAWEDLWYDVLEYEDDDHPALAGHGAGPGAVVEGDERRLFVYGFRDPALVNLLRAATRQIWRDRDAARAHRSVVEGTRALEHWLDRHFTNTWAHALHFRAALLQVRDLQTEAARLEDLGNRLRLLARLQHHIARARATLEPGGDAGDLFATLVWYADTLIEIGRYAEAPGVLLEARALVDQRRVSIPKYRNVGLTLKIGGAWRQLADYKRAESALRHGLNEARELLGDDHPLTLDFYILLGSVHFNAGRYDQAERWMRHAVTECEQVLGASDSRTLSATGNLGNLYTSLNRHDEAGRLIRFVLETSERMLGPDHTDTLVAANNLALLYVRSGRYGEAEPLYQRVLRARTQELGPEHPTVLGALNNLAGLYLRCAEYEKAEPLLVQAFSGFQRMLGPEHEETLRAANNIGSLYYSWGRYGDAEPPLRWAVNTSVRVLEPEHEVRMIAQRNLAEVLRARSPGVPT